MPTLSYIALISLCSFSAFSSVTSIQCNETHYPWPTKQPNLCCKKCPPGEHLISRPEDSCGTMCGPCVGNRFTDTYNEEYTCNVCRVCSKSNMEYKSPCNASHDAECSCKAGYKCKDRPCTYCMQVGRITTPLSTTDYLTISPTDKAMTPAAKPTSDPTWLLVIIGLLCVGISLIVLRKIPPFLHWITSRLGYFSMEKPAPAPQCTEDDGVCTPVQEVSGKSDCPSNV